MSIFQRLFGSSTPTNPPDEQLEAQKKQLELVEKEVADVREDVRRYAATMVAMGSAGVSLSASLSRLYARNDARALSVAQFKHCQTVLDSLATKVFKDDLQSDVLQVFDRWRGQTELLRSKTRDFEAARLHVHSMRQTLASLHQYRTARLKKGIKLTATEEKELDRAEFNSKKYAAALDSMRTALASLFNDVAGETRFAAFDQILFRMMELQHEVYSSVSGLTDSFKIGVNEYRGRAASRDDAKESKDADEAAAAAAAFAIASGGMTQLNARSIAEHHQRLFGELTAGTANLMSATEEEVPTPVGGVSGANRIRAQSVEQLAVLQDEVARFLAEEMAEQEQHMALAVTGHTGAVTEADVAALAHGIPGQAGTAVMGLGAFPNNSPHDHIYDDNNDDNSIAVNSYHPPPPSHMPQNHDDTSAPSSSPGRRERGKDSVSMLAQQVLAVLGPDAVNSVGGLPSGAAATSSSSSGGSDSFAAPARGRGVSVYATAVASEAAGGHAPGTPNPMDAAFASLAAELAAKKASEAEAAAAAADAPETT